MEIMEIAVPLDVRDFDAQLRITSSQEKETIRALLNTAEALINAKAAYKVSYIEKKLEDGVIVDRTFLRSRVLRKNLDSVQRVFPYVITIGRGLEEKAGACDDLLEKYYFDVIGNTALRQGRKYLEEHLKARFSLEGISYMSPGSLADWPIEEQTALFSIFEGGETAVGVELNENFLMIPRKSISGLYFPTEISFYNCQLCPRGHCEGRKAPYNKALAKDYGV